MISARSLGRLEHVHNDYLHLLVDFGIVGTGLWIASVLVLLRRLLARRGSPVAGAAALALIGAAAMGVTDNPMVYGFVTAPIGLLVGVSLAGLRVAQR